MHDDAFLREHYELTRRYFLTLLAGTAIPAVWAAQEPPGQKALATAIAKLEPYFTPQEEFRDVSRGSPKPHSLSDAKKKEVGLTQETWKLEVIGDPEKEHKPTLGKTLTRKEGTALDFKALLALSKKHAVRFNKVMTCLNIGCPLGMGLWEGVPLREVVWMTKPKENVRRVMFHGYHNDDPKQLFQSSLPIGRVLEDPFDLPPVILCYKVNGEWLNAKHGGPVRMVVPEGYGFKSIKWLTTVTLSNRAHSNDTYAHGNNDIDSPLKSFAATLSVPQDIKAKELLPITGYAQVGISGVSKVQVWVQEKGKEKDWPADDPYFAKAPWKDARILPAPAKWGGKFPGDAPPKGTMGFDEMGKPRTWPMRLAKVHWAILLPGLPAGEYVLRSRTVDEKGHGQPMPRPFRKSGHCAIEAVKFEVKA